MLLVVLSRQRRDRNDGRPATDRRPPAEGVHPECIQGDEMMRQKIAYIHNNPVTRGYVDEPEHWRYSSARNYAGIEGLFDVCTEW